MLAMLAHLLPLTVIRRRHEILHLWCIIIRKQWIKRPPDSDHLWGLRQPPRQCQTRDASARFMPCNGATVGSYLWVVAPPSRSRTAQSPTRGCQRSITIDDIRPDRCGKRSWYGYRDASPGNTIDDPKVIEW